MRPLTERWAKPVLPVDGRPVLALLLRELAAAGCAHAFVVTGHRREQVEALAGDGRAFGLDVRYALQPEISGSADAVVRALRAGAEPPAIVVAADNVFAAGEIRRFAGAVDSGLAGALAVRPGLAPTPSKPGVRVADGMVGRVYDLDPALPLTAAPLWVLGPALVPFLDDLPGPPFELRDAYQRAIDAGHPVAAVEIAPSRDLTTPLDLLEQNFPYLGGLG